LLHKKPVGERVGIIGAGGIGCDVALYLAHEKTNLPDNEAFYKNWGIGQEKEPSQGKRSIYLLQRKKGDVGKGPGKTTGWIHKQELKKYKVQGYGDITYKEWNGKTLKVLIGQNPQEWDLDTLVVCSGQESYRPLEGAWIGGAHRAGELDAERAIQEGTLWGERI
jgi:2,4-dienoyl-CoA reductase (NADPH2)